MRVGSLVFVMVLVAAACGSDSDGTGAPDAGLDLPVAAEVMDALDAADTLDAIDTAVEASWDAEAAVELPGLDEGPEAEATAEVEPEIPAMPPVPPMPPVGLFDCTHDPAKLPGRVSPVPLTCVIDPACHQPMVVGHRSTGADLGPLAPENSLAAMRAAIVSGVDGVEMDVQDTQDGQLVVFHDGEVDTTLEGTGSVGALTLAQIQAMPFQMGKVISGGDFSCERVATLEEALKLVKGRVFVDLDLKSDRVDLIVPLVRDLGMLDQVFFSTTSIAKLQQVQALEPKARLQARPDTMEQLQAALDGLDPDPDILELPEPPNAFTSVAPTTIHVLGRKALANSFPTDLQAYLLSDLSLLVALYDGGLDILQSDMPTQVVKALGRWKY